MGYLTHQDLPQEPSVVRTNYPTPTVKWGVTLSILLFILLGIALIPYAGIENDEALFAGPLYGDVPQSDRVEIAGHKIALMLMSYLGTLKTWVFAYLFNRWRPGVWSMRLPVLLVGALTIYLFYRLVRRSCGRAAAMAGCALLATDTCFLLTTIYDWGPVAFQHLLMVGGALMLVKFAQEGGRRHLAWGFLLFGLAMWDKALAAWWLGGLGVAALAIFWREVRLRLRPVNLTVAVAAFSLGALPLVIYNVSNPLKTFAGNTKFSTKEFNQKIHLLKYTLEGSSLFGYVMVDEWDKQVREPAGVLEKASVGLRDAVGERRRSLMFWGLIAAIAAVPLWWQRRRAVFFTLVFSAVTWLQMAFTKDAGGGVHHTILLWPWPHVITAAAIAGIYERYSRGPALATTVAGVIAISGLLVTNQSLAQLVRHGTANVWTDAIFPLNAELKKSKGRHMFIMDWGMYEVLRAMNRGSLAVWNSGDAVLPAINEGQLKEMFALNGLYVTHVNGREVIAGTNANLREGAARVGYRQVVRNTIADRNGRPVFEISEFVPVQK